MSEKEKTIKDGKDGEEAFAKWLDEEGLGYVWITQTPDTFAARFNGTVKRPDFLVVLESIGVLAIDVKHCTSSNNEFTLEIDRDLKRILKFERISRIPIWYAFHEKNKVGCWHWISALKIQEEEYDERTNKSTNKDFLVIKKTEFIEISSNDDLGQLYTQRVK